jgi:hypothetical protein
MDDQRMRRPYAARRRRVGDGALDERRLGELDGLV